METLSQTDNQNEEFGSPFDEESIKIITSIPQSSPSHSKHGKSFFLNNLNYIFRFLNILGLILYGIGALGIGAVAYNHFTQDNKPFPLMQFLIALTPFIIGYLLKSIPKFNTSKVEKKSLAILSTRLINYLKAGDINGSRRVAQTILFDSPKIKSQASDFIFAISYEVLSKAALKDSHYDQAKEYAIKSIEYCNKLLLMGINTPLLYYTLANSLRTAKLNQEAIDAYSKYLSLRPKDEASKLLLEEIKLEKE